jgi:hypothetical protein
VKKQNVKKKKEFKNWSFRNNGLICSLERQKMKEKREKKH